MGKADPAGKSGGRSVLLALVFLAFVVLCGATGFLVGGGPAVPVERSFTILARQYGYEPAVLRVNRGDTVRLRFASLDVVHGFYLEGHNLDVTIVPMRSTVQVRRLDDPEAEETVEEVVFTVEREGKFRYRCSHTCGFMHPFMLGELIVGPNRLFPTSLGLTLGVLLGGFTVAWMRTR